MRCFTLMLMLLMLTACGKTGALYLPEEEQAPVPAPAPQPEPAPDADSSGKAD